MLPPSTPQPGALHALRQRIEASSDDQLIPMGTGWGPGLPLIERGAVHEWFGEVCPAALLSGLAARACTASGGQVVWIGRAYWAYPGWISPDLLRHSLFIDPAGDAERAWTIDQALRCPGVACVIADGGRIDMAMSRRFQLAAAAGGALGLLVRPPDELGVLSAARTRWRVDPAPNHEARLFCEPRWTVELLRCKGLQPTKDARRWVVQLHHDSRDVTLVPPSADRSVETARAWRHA